MKIDYGTIDRIVCAAIHSGRNTFTLLTVTRDVMDQAEAIAAKDNEQRKHGYQKVEGWRVVDRRLQALRKAGKIIHSHGKWAVLGGAA